LKLPVVSYDAVDRSGHDPSGKAVMDDPGAEQIISAAFATDVGVDNDPIEAGSGFVWYDVAGITPAHDRNLDEVKSEVENRWRDDEIAKRLKAKTADMLDKLKNGASLDALAADNGVKIETANGIKRGQPSKDITGRMLDTIFHTANNGFGSAEGDKPTDWIVFRLTDDKIPALVPDSPDAKQIDQQVGREMSDDVFGQYMAWVEDNLGTSVNQAALTQAVGNGAPDTN
jgi:peptidyl-prolyl cis-trans isomerase D